MSGAVITTARLVLRPPRPDDAADIHRNIADWDVVKNLSMPPWPYTIDDAHAFVANASGLVIEQRGNGEVIGGIGISERDGGDFIGYWLGKAHWKQGLASEAVHALITDYFDHTESDELHSGFVHDNEASWKLQQRIGFERVGEGMQFMVARKADVREIKTRLTRSAYEKVTQ